MKTPVVYLLASRRCGTLYVGVTSNIVQRIWQHREGLVDGFTRRYQVKRLVWYERHEAMLSAISREKAIKRWRRQWKLELVERMNPDWRDLWPDIASESAVTPARGGIHDGWSADGSPLSRG